MRRDEQMTPQVVLIMGVSGSGKTTIGLRLADALGWSFCDGDVFHSPANLEKLRQGVPLTDEDRRPWLGTLRSALTEWIEQGRHVVLACSALKAAFRRALVEGLEDRLCVVYLKGDFDLIKQRLVHREGHFMHKDLLASQFEILEEPAEALVIDVADSPDHIVARIRSALGR
ncbi:MAG TPA: gluconokinase [Nitrospiraceae bacterium]|nr:gluconokinase [Nitrospiraceae bacterium]